MLSERLSKTELLKFTLERRGHWYVVNAWGRGSKRGAWAKVWCDRAHVSYLAAWNEYQDTGAALQDWKNQMSVANLAA